MLILMLLVCFSYIDILKSLKKNQFLQDVHIPELLVFAAGTDLHDHVLYNSGEIIFQDKVICCFLMSHKYFFPGP